MIDERSLQSVFPNKPRDGGVALQLARSVFNQNLAGLFLQKKRLLQ